MQENTVYVDTHAHLDGEEFKDDLPEVIERAKTAGVGAIMIPAVDRGSIVSVMDVCRQFPGYCFPMLGLQPEEVKEDWEEVLADMKQVLDRNLREEAGTPFRYVAVGECGLDFYWSREFEKEQIKAFERQLEWSVEYQLPLMIHCRKAQNEMLHLMKPYAKELPGGVFHCFTGNRKEAEDFLQMERFCLGIGGVSTFKSSHLREDLPASVPLNRLVLETDSPYMAPVPQRGKRNESAFVAHILTNLAQSYGVSESEVAMTTNDNVFRLFGIKPA
ncbi:TatD family hydrolase [Hallella bergensis]|uniref:TatD family hydrolase n=1 Tax=Hallella bergensis TaxID=242750 RepID=UPI003990B631